MTTLSGITSEPASIAWDASAAAESECVAEGAVRVPAFALPESSFLSADERNALKQARERQREWDTAHRACPPLESASRADIPTIRKCQAEVFYNTCRYRRMHNCYDVALTSVEIGGVYTEVFTPVAGVSPDNANRILINVHGGGFQDGSRTISHLESIPIASVGKIKVVSIDYRMAPEHTYPAASQDVAAVYRELLKTFKPENIGVYGCSAGAVLTAQAVAWFLQDRLPLPGAVGMFCGAGSHWAEGDSGHIGAALAGAPLGTPYVDPYFRSADPNDPLVFPARSTQILAKFPPSLLIASTRDFALSSVAYTHSMLIKHGVAAELHVWEGLGHAFFFDPDLPQSREVYVVNVKFFNKYLGK